MVRRSASPPRSEVRRTGMRGKGGLAASRPGTVGSQFAERRLRRTLGRTGERSLFMGWRRGELWLDTDILWVGEGNGTPALAGVEPSSLPRLAPPPGLAASRRRRDEWTRHRHARRARASVVALSPAVVFALAGLRSDSARTTSFLAEDPPSLTFRIGPALDVLADGAVPPKSGSAAKRHVHRTIARADAMPKIEWHHAQSLGLPYSGSLEEGTQLPIKGADWVTWNPITDSRPNLPDRLY